MGRIRTIKPEFPQSESMGRVSREARLLFILLWGVCDDSGRARGSSRMLASLLYPYDNDAPRLIDRWLSELERESCILRYVVDGDSYLEVCNWLKHQKIDRASKPLYPSPSNTREGSRGLCEGSSLDQGSGIRDQGPGIKDQVTGTSVATTGGKPARRGPTTGDICWDPQTGWSGITDQDKAAWVLAYPACDIDRQLAAMSEWCKSNPAKARKSNWRAFVTRWLTKSQDHGGDCNGRPNTRTGPAGGTAVEKASARNQARRAHEFDDGEIPLPIVNGRATKTGDQTPLLGRG